MAHTFKNLETWMKSSPSKEEQEAILSIINRKAISLMRRECYFKTRELIKLDRFKSQTLKLGLEVSETLKKKIGDLQDEIAKMQREVPPSKPRTKKPQEKSNEEIKEEAKTE